MQCRMVMQSDVSGILHGLTQPTKISFRKAANVAEITSRGPEQQPAEDPNRLYDYSLLCDRVESNQGLGHQVARQRSGHGGEMDTTSWTADTDNLITL